MLSHFFKMLKRCTEESRFSDKFIFSSYNFSFQQKKKEELKVNNLNLKEDSSVMTQASKNCKKERQFVLDHA